MPTEQPKTLDVQLSTFKENLKKRAEDLAKARTDANAPPKPTE